MISLGLDPSLTGFGWCIHRSDVIGPARVVAKGHHVTDAKAIFVTRYILLRGLLLKLLEEHPEIQAVGVESPPFGESYSEGLYGLFVYVCEAVYLYRKDVVFFDPQSVKRLVKMDPTVRRGTMDKSDMVEAARIDSGILKGRFNHNEADAYHIARFAARFWEFVDGVLTEDDLTPSEKTSFYKVHQFTRGAKAGKTVVTGLSFRENERFFRFSKIPQEV
jgi:Holliday junction resolvasome RuvABC endonuclease subunit